ncbi:MFS transporter [Cupriavidus pauculus]|nr:MFS transporter [Cupriavidus pauculus]
MDMLQQQERRAGRLPQDALPHEAATSASLYARWQWRALLGVTFCYLFYYTGRQTFGFAIPGIQAELRLSKSALGWVSATMLWAYAVGQSINGNLGDKFGGRVMMLAGAILSFLANVATSEASGLVSLIVFWGMNGYFQAMGFAPGSRLISNWWGHGKRGFVYSFYVGGSSLSSVIAYVLPILILQVLGLGWREIFRYAPMLMVAGALAMFFVVRERPEDLGLKGPEQSAGGASEREYASSAARYKAVLSQWRLYVTALSIGFQNAARYALLIWIPVHFFGPQWKSHPDGIDPMWITLALPVGMAIGAITNGWLSDALFGSRRYLSIVSYMVIATLVAMGMIVLPHGSPWAVAAIMACGFFVYGPASSFWALCPDIVGRKLAGTATGCVNFVSYLFAGLAEPMMGRLMDHTGSTAVIFPVVASLCMASAITAIFIRR